MNSLVNNQFGLLHETQSMRNDLMAILSDSDLRYRLPGNNVTLGELCRQSGEIEYTYIESFRTFKQDFSYHCDDPELATSVEKLSAWLKSLDAELDATLSGLSEEDLKTKRIDRGFSVPVEVQFHIYREALIIFYGKASLYLRALEKELPGLFPTWIG
jgi:hypothetical protein